MDTTGDIRMSDLMSPATQTEGINPTSKDWHLQMKALNQQTKQLEGMSSHVVKSCVEHADTEAGQINMMDSMVGQGVHQMMGSGWKGDQEGHQDIYDASIGGCKWPMRAALSTCACKSLTRAALATTREAFATVCMGAARVLGQ